MATTFIHSYAPRHLTFLRDSARRAVVSEGLAARGFSVTVLGRDAAAGEALVERIESNGGEAIFEAVDLLSFEDIRDFSERVRKRDEPLDLLVNNAGGD